MYDIAVEDTSHYHLQKTIELSNRVSPNVRYVLMFQYWSSIVTKVPHSRKTGENVCRGRGGIREQSLLFVEFSVSSQKIVY